MAQALLYAFCGTGFTFLLTAVGAAVVFLFKGEIKVKFQQSFLGFAAGVMIAASVFSLLIPSIEAAKNNAVTPWLPAAGGFFIGWIFLLAMDMLLPHLHANTQTTEGMPSRLKRTTMLVMAVTLHNFPEGLAVGLAFGLAAKGSDTVTLAAAVALAIGIGIQNCPEGAAISLPLRNEGMSRTKAFLCGAASGLAEPVAGIAAVFMIGTVTAILPWMLSFAAGAMIYVVIEELIPEAHLGEHSIWGTSGAMIGFLVMMILDVALG